MEAELQDALQAVPPEAVPPEAVPPAATGKKRQGGRVTIQQVEDALPPPNSVGVGAIGIKKALLAGTMDDLTADEGKAANTVLCDMMTSLRRTAIKMSRDTGCSIELLVKPNDAFSTLDERKKTFRTGYINSFLAESYGPDLPWRPQEVKHEIFDHVSKLVPGASRKELLKVADRLDIFESVEILGCDEYEKEDEAEREREARREAKRAAEAALEASLLDVDPLSVLPKSALTEAELPVVNYIKDMASDLFFRDCSKPAWVQLDFSDARSAKAIKDVYKGVERPAKKPNHPNNSLTALQDFLDNGYWRGLGLSDPRQFFTWISGILQDEERYKQVRARLNTALSTSSKHPKWENRPLCTSFNGTRDWDAKLFAIFVRLLWDYGGQHDNIEETQQAFEAATAY